MSNSEKQTPIEPTLEQIQDVYQSISDYETTGQFPPMLLPKAPTYVENKSESIKLSRGLRVGVWAVNSVSDFVLVAVEKMGSSIPANSDYVSLPRFLRRKR